MHFDHHLLPAELWLEILAHLAGEPYTIDHVPFETIPGVFEPQPTPLSSVVQVCRTWRTWAIPLLYRDLEMPQSVSKSEGLLMCEEYGHYVQRAVLPYSSTVTESISPPPSTRFIALCSGLKILVRPPHAASPFDRWLKFEFDAPCPSLESVRRIEWWGHDMAYRTGGINALTAVLNAAPHVEYLFIGSTRRHSVTHGLGLGSERVSLPALRTLRLRSSNPLVPWYICRRWALPALHTLVADRALTVQGMGQIWDALGARLARVEFGKHVDFLWNDHVSACLRACPSLREINYYVFITMAPAPNDEDGTRCCYPAVERIGLNFADVPILGEGSTEWIHLSRHFDALVSGMFPNLALLCIWEISATKRADRRLTQLLGRLECAVHFVDA